MTDLREQIRDSAEKRFAAQEALETVKDVILTFKPVNLIATSEVGSDKAIQPAEYQNFFRDWFNWVKDVQVEAKPLLTKMVKDALSLYAEPEGTPESK